jgi:hypothetical protein
MVTWDVECPGDDAGVPVERPLERLVDQGQDRVVRDALADGERRDA